MSKRKKNKTFNNDDCYNIYSNAKIPPCAEFLGSNNPLIKDGEIIFKNNNRLFFFISYNTLPLSSIVYNPCDPNTYTRSTNGNYQIPTYLFLIALYINCIQKGQIENDENIKIHEDDNADGFIKNILNSELFDAFNQFSFDSSNFNANNSSEESNNSSNNNVEESAEDEEEGEGEEILNTLDSSFIPSVSYAISNSNSILPFYYGNIQISPINFYIIFMLSRFQNDYGLLYGNNSYVTYDFINHELASMYCNFSAFNFNNSL